jgi:hypothetical protein
MRGADTPTGGQDDRAFLPMVTQTDRKVDPMDVMETLVSQMLDDGAVSEVIRPAAILAEEAAQAILLSLTQRDVRLGGCWLSEPTRWQLYDGPWNGADGGPGQATLLGTLHLVYGTPTRHDITVYRTTVTQAGVTKGWTVASLCDAAFAYAGLTLESCPRATLTAPPKPFRMT